MREYYDRKHKQEIIGFYCFVADKPPESVVKPKERLRVVGISELISSFISLHSNSTSTTKSHSWV